MPSESAVVDLDALILESTERMRVILENPYPSFEEQQELLQLGDLINSNVRLRHAIVSESNARGYRTRSGVGAVAAHQ